MVPTRTVALSGQNAPGTVAGVNFYGFDVPILDFGGRTAFRAVLTGVVTTSDNTGVWSGATATPSCGLTGPF